MVYYPPGAASRYGVPAINAIGFACPVSSVISHARDLRNQAADLFAFREVLDELVRRDLKVRYKRSTLGVAWTLLTPLLMMAISTVIFSSFFRFAIENFPVYMLSGQVVWMFFSQGTMNACPSVLMSGGLSRRVYVPLALFPIASVNAVAFNAVLSLIPLFVIVMLTGGHLSWALLSVPLALIITLLFTYGVSLIISASTVFFHDTLQMYQVALTALMYLVPIFYPIEIVPREWSFIVEWNPLYHMVEIFRQPVYGGIWPDAHNLLVASGYALISLLVGWMFFHRVRNDMPAYL
jgi:ABC-2 type transport system permease protein